MKLTDASLKIDKVKFEEKNYELPKYDREAVRKKTMKSPKWIHFGAGNIFRAFTASVQQDVLNQDMDDTGIIVCEGYDYEVIEKAYKEFDDLSLLVVLKPDGNIKKEVVGSVVESLTSDKNNEADIKRLEEIFTNPSLQMASFTITEKGYSVKNTNGEVYPFIESDIKEGPKNPGSLMGRIAYLCYKRYQAGKYPLALVSMDNCSHNGTILYQAVSTIVEGWVENEFVEKDFLDYINNPNCVSFPWSMIDKITPRPDEKVKKQLEEDGFESTDIIITSKHTYTAPFVNAEEPQYLVIEDLFPNKRPNLDKGGVIFTDRETVDKIEKMKVCTCLNPLHTALAVYGCLLSHTLIAEEMNDKELKALVEKIGYQEGLPVVVDPGVIRPKDFIKEVIDVRLPNPFLPDSPQRIATDTSQKLSIRFGETIKAYRDKEGLDPKELKYIPLALAGWIRYLLGVDDNGDVFEISPDPMLDIVKKYVEGIKLGDGVEVVNQIKPLLEDEKIFGVNLYEVGLGEKVTNYFVELIKGTGAVRATLKEIL